MIRRWERWRRCRARHAFRPATTSGSWSIGILQRRDLEAGADVVQVLPAHLVGQAVLVVGRRIQLIEGLALAVRRVLVAEA